MKKKDKAAKLEGTDFLVEYRAHPERYLPLTDDQYKHFDRWEEQILLNEYWGAGLLEGNRPYFLEVWKVFGVRTLTVIVSAEGTTQEEIVRMIIRAGLLSSRTPEKVEFNFKPTVDDHGNKFIGVNAVISKETDDSFEQYYHWMGNVFSFDKLDELNNYRR